jgi:hypothetical protein
MKLDNYSNERRTNCFKKVLLTRLGSFTLYRFVYEYQEIETIIFYKARYYSIYMQNYYLNNVLNQS